MIEWRKDIKVINNGIVRQGFPLFLRRRWTLLVEVDCFFVSVSASASNETATVIICVLGFRVQEVDLVVAEEGGEIGLFVYIVEEFASGGEVVNGTSLFGFELLGASESSGSS